MASGRSHTAHRVTPRVTPRELEDRLGCQGQSVLRTSDHDSFYAAKITTETGRKDKNESLAFFSGKCSVRGGIHRIVSHGTKLWTQAK